jgi:hypothetical protein
MSRKPVEGDPGNQLEERTASSAASRRRPVAKCQYICHESRQAKEMETEGLWRDLRYRNADDCHKLNHRRQRRRNSDINHPCLRASPSQLSRLRDCISMLPPGPTWSERREHGGHGPCPPPCVSFWGGQQARLDGRTYPATQTTEYTHFGTSSKTRLVIWRQLHPSRKLLNFYSPRHHRPQPTPLPSHSNTRHQHTHTLTSSTRRLSLTAQPLLPNHQPPNHTFKMTGGGKSGGKASGAKNAQS